MIHKRKGTQKTAALLLALLTLGACSQAPAPPRGGAPSVWENGTGSREDMDSIRTDTLSPRKDAPFPVLYCYDPDTDAYTETALPSGNYTLASLVLETGDLLGMAFSLRGAYMEPDGRVAVDFAAGSQPVARVGGMAEVSALASIARTLIENQEGARQVVFRAEGAGYESGHFSYGADEPYLVPGTEG